MGWHVVSAVIRLQRSEDSRLTDEISGLGGILLFERASYIRRPQQIRPSGRDNTCADAAVIAADDAITKPHDAVVGQASTTTRRIHSNRDVVQTR